MNELIEAQAAVIERQQAMIDELRGYVEALSAALEQRTRDDLERMSTEQRLFQRIGFVERAMKNFDAAPKFEQG